MYFLRNIIWKTSFAVMKNMYGE